MPEYKIKETSQGYLLCENTLINRSKVIVYISEKDKELAEDLQLYLSHYFEDRKFFREIRKSLENLPPPTELEKIQMNEALYEERVRRLKTFLEKVSNSKPLVEIACRLVLTSISGSRERAMQAWMHNDCLPTPKKDII